jgi:TonB family protein
MADTVRLEGTESSELVLPDTHFSTTGSFVIERAGQKTRLEVSASGNKTMAIFDGENLWTYIVNTRTYQKVSKAPGPASDQFGRLKVSRDPALFHDAKVEREETLQLDKVPVVCYVVQAAYDSMPGNLRARDISRTVWIAKDDYTVLRDTWDFYSVVGTGLATAKAHISDEYTAVKWGMPIPDERFVFTPPPGSTQVVLAPGSSAAAVPRLSPAELVHEVKPEYTGEGRAAGLQGTVSLYVEFDGGHPRIVQVMQGLGLGLDENAVEAVEKWEYSRSPGSQEIDVQFRLDPPAPWSVAGEAYTVPVDTTKKRVVKPVPTRYIPPDASACAATGDVELGLVIGADGNPREIARTRGDTGPLADAAVKAVEGWHFQPATVDGEPAEAHGEVELECRHEGMLLENEKGKLPVYRVGGGVSAPVLLSKVEPEYSEQARQEKLQGSVQLYVQISPTGNPTGIRVVKSLGSGLDQKAMEAIKRWRFKPGMKDGQPVAVEATIDVNFKLL